MRLPLLLRPACIACFSALPLVLSACRDSTAPGPPGVRGRWYQPQSGWSRARPAVSGSTVYFGDGYGEVIARDVINGERKWTSRVGQDPIDGANILVRAGVVVAPLLYHTAGLDAATGRELWRYKAPNDTVGIPQGYFAAPGYVAASHIDADDQTVYIPAWGASVSAVDIHTGVARWVWQPGRLAGDTATSGVFRSGATSVRVSGDTIFATMWHFLNRPGGYSEAWLVAIDRVAGRELWRVLVSSEGSGVFISAPPIVYENLVIVHTLPSRTYAIDRATQKVVWEFSVPSGHLSTVGPELFGDILYVDGGDEQMHALRARDGSGVWSAPFPAQATHALLVTQRRIIFPTGGDLIVLDRDTGRMVAVTTQPQTSDPLFSSGAAFSNGLVFVTVADGAWCFDEP